MVEKELAVAAEFIHQRGGGGFKRGFAAQLGDGKIAHAITDQNQVFHRCTDSNAGSVRIRILTVGAVQKSRASISLDRLLHVRLRSPMGAAGRYGPARLHRRLFWIIGFDRDIVLAENAGDLGENPRFVNGRDPEVVGAGQFAHRGDGGSLMYSGR